MKEKIILIDVRGVVLNAKITAALMSVQKIGFRNKKSKKRIMQIDIEILCIENGEWQRSLTIGKKYKAIAQMGDAYLLKDNFNNTHWFFKSRFKKI